jgi:hypothetical protein
VRTSVGALLLPLALGCADAAARDGRHFWLAVAGDSLYRISIDTSRITKPTYRTYLIWYRTDHAMTHLYKGQPFNREVVGSLLRCGDLAYKVVSVDMSMGSDEPISQQRADANDVALQPWRHAERGTIEWSAARRSCDLARERGL